MHSPPLHIPFWKTITDLFQAYGIGVPLHPEIMCMRLEDQPETKQVQMPLYRINFFRVIHFYESTLDFVDADQPASIPSNCVLFSFPGKLESWNYEEKQRGGYVIYFSMAFAGLDMTDPHFDETYPYFNPEAGSILPLDQVNAQILRELSDELIEETYSDRIDKWGMVHKLLHVYLAKIRRLYVHHCNDTLPPDIRTNRTLFYRFRTELDNYFHDLGVKQVSAMPSVSIMAQRLKVNANYLNSSLKKIAGRTASSYIQDKIMLEAKVCLLHSDLQVAEIAYNLGFEHVSYFNRFFKKHAHCAPAEFRNAPRQRNDL